MNLRWIYRWWTRLLGKPTASTQPPRPQVLPDWWQKKMSEVSAPPGPTGVDDLLRSVKAALNQVPAHGNIVLGIPEDNNEVMEALARCGGEIRITIRSAPRPILDLLTQDSLGDSSQSVVSTVEVPELPGTFFTGGGQ